MNSHISCNGSIAHKCHLTAIALQKIIYQSHKHGRQTSNDIYDQLLIHFLPWRSDPKCTILASETRDRQLSRPLALSVRRRGDGTYGLV